MVGVGLCNINAVFADYKSGLRVWTSLLRRDDTMQAFLAIAMVRSPEHLGFKSTDEQVNTCCIVFMMYMAVFLVTCCMLRSREEEQTHPEDVVVSDQKLDNQEMNEVGRLQ